MAGLLCVCVCEANATIVIEELNFSFLGSICCSVIFENIFLHKTQIPKKEKRARADYLCFFLNQGHQLEKDNSMKSVNATDICCLEENAFVNTYPRRMFPEEAATSSRFRMTSPMISPAPHHVGGQRLCKGTRTSPTCCRQGKSWSNGTAFCGKGCLTALSDTGIHILVDLEGPWNLFLINK